MAALTEAAGRPDALPQDLRQAAAKALAEGPGFAWDNRSLMAAAWARPRRGHEGPIVLGEPRALRQRFRRRLPEVLRKRVRPPGRLCQSCHSSLYHGLRPPVKVFFSAKHPECGC